MVSNRVETPGMSQTSSLTNPSTVQDCSARPVFVSADVTRQVLDWKEVIQSLQDAYRIPHGPLMSPARTVARADGTWLRALTAVPPNSRFMGAKIFGLSRHKTVNYVVVLIDQTTGDISGFVDGHLVTGFRTGATSAVAVDRIAPREPAVLGILGSGLEARAHVEAIAAVRTIKALKVFSPTPARREAFADECGKRLGVKCTAVATAEAAVADCTIAVAAARSHDEAPVLLGKWLHPGMMVVSIGSTIPEQREIDEEVVDRCDVIVCDAVDEVIHETGDMIAAAAAGIQFRHKVIALNAVISGQADAQLATARLPMFKSVGAAIQDLVVAEAAYRKAVAQGLVVELPIEFLTKRA